jgi:hypothetical protein
MTAHMQTERKWRVLGLINGSCIGRVAVPNYTANRILCNVFFLFCSSKRLRFRRLRWEADFCVLMR